MPHYPEKFRELHEHFLDAHAKYDSLDFQLVATESYSFCRSRPDLYDILCYTGFPPAFSTKAAVTVFKQEESEEPYSEFKGLARKAWTFLPETIKRPIVETLHKTDEKPEYDYEHWVDFLFFLLAQRDWRSPPPEINEPNYRPPDEFSIAPFRISADVIFLCRLGTDEPKNPYELKLPKPEVLSAQSQDDNEGDQGENNGSKQKVRKSKWDHVVNFGLELKTEQPNIKPKEILRRYKKRFPKKDQPTHNQLRDAMRYRADHHNEEDSPDTKKAYFAQFFKIIHPYLPRANHILDVEISQKLLFPFRQTR